MTLAKRSFLAILLAFSLSAIWLGIFPHEASRVFLNQRRAVLSIRDVSLAERNYATRHPEAGYACKLSNLGEQGFVDVVLASGTKSGYRFEIRCFQDGGQEVTSYTVTAVPVSPGVTGKYALCTNQSGEIWYSENGAAAACLAMHKQIERKYRDAVQR